MQENIEKISLKDLRSATGGIYASMLKGQKSTLLDTIVAQYGGSKDAWQHRLSSWANGTEYSEVNEYLEREVHRFIGLNCGKVDDRR